MKRLFRRNFEGISANSDCARLLFPSCSSHLDLIREVLYWKIFADNSVTMRALASSRGFPTGFRSGSSLAPKSLARVDMVTLSLISARPLCVKRLGLLGEQAMHLKNLLRWYAYCWVQYWKSFSINPTSCVVMILSVQWRLNLRRKK